MNEVTTLPARAQRFACRLCEDGGRVCAWSPTDPLQARVMPCPNCRVWPFVPAA